MSLEVVNPQAEALHEQEQKLDGSRRAVLRPSAHRALVNVKEAREGALRQREARQQASECLGVHLATDSEAQIHDGVVAAFDLIIGKLGKPRRNVGDDGRRRELVIGERHQHIELAAREFIAERVGVARVVLKERDQLGGAHVAMRLLMFLHFILQRARAPFRMRMTLQDILPGSQGAIA